MILKQYKNVNFKTKYMLRILGWKIHLVQLRKKDINSWVPNVSFSDASFWLMYLLEKKLLQKIYSFLESQSLRSWALPLGNSAFLRPETTTAQKNAHRRQEVCVCFIFSKQGHLSEWGRTQHKLELWVRHQPRLQL